MADREVRTGGRARPAQQRLKTLAQAARIVDVGEAVVSPISATESAVRGVLNAVRSKTGL